MRVAAWLAAPVVLTLNGYVLWRGTSPRLNWVVAGCAGRVFVRLFLRRRRGRADVQEPDVVMLGASEIASISARTVEVFLYGPKPRVVEWLVVEAAQAVAEDVSGHIRPLLSDVGCDPGRQAIVANEEGRLTMKWEWCRPVLPVFLQQVVRECPSVVIAHEDRSELDLNGIWHGLWRKPDAQERHMLVQAKRLGFGCKCVWLLRRYKYMAFKDPFRDPPAYLAEIEREEAGTGRSAVQR